MGSHHQIPSPSRSAIRTSPLKLASGLSARTSSDLGLMKVRNVSQLSFISLSTESLTDGLHSIVPHIVLDSPFRAILLNSTPGNRRSLLQETGGGKLLLAFLVCCCYWIRFWYTERPLERPDRIHFILQVVMTDEIIAAANIIELSVHRCIFEDSIR